MSIVNGGSRAQLDIICRSTSSRCLIRPTIWAQLKHYFLQFDLPQYSNCSYGDNVQVNIKPKCLTLLRHLNIKRLDILTYPIIKPQHQVVEENVTEPVLATLCGAAPIPTVDTFGSSARCHPASSNPPPPFYQRSARILDPGNSRRESASFFLARPREMIFWSLDLVMKHESNKLESRSRLEIWEWSYDNLDLVLPCESKKKNSQSCLEKLHLLSRVRVRF